MIPGVSGHTRRVPIQRVRWHDDVRLGDLEYTFQTAIGACLDAAHHVVADPGLGAPTSNADVFRLLGRAGLLTTT